MGGFIITSKLKNVFFAIFVILCFCLFLVNAQMIKTSVLDTLLFCFNKLIPSVFPFMVLATFVCNAELLSCFIPQRLARVLGICKNTTSIVVTSWVSGYVTGPKLLNGRCNDEDATKLVFLTTNAGIGFVVSYIGIALWNSITFGIFLYFSQILFSVFLYSFGYKPNISLQKRMKKPLFTSFSESVHQSTQTVVEMCGFTVTVNVYSTVLCEVLHINNSVISALVKSVSEISTGSYNLCSLNTNYISLFLIGFTLGFGGVCVILQTVSSCSECRINRFKLVGLKFIQGVFCGLSVLVFSEFYKLTPITSAGLFKTVVFEEKIAIINAIFIFCLMNLVKKILKIKNLY